MAKKKKAVRLIGKILFLLYIAFLVYFLIFSDWYGRAGVEGYHYNLTPFLEIRRFWEYRDQVGFGVMLANLAGNVLIFLPFGFFLPMASRYRSFFVTIFYSFALSFLVETFQLLTQVGSFDVDDLLLNTLGGAIGYILFSIGSYITGRKHGSKKRNK